MKMKLSKFLELIQEGVDEAAQKGAEHSLPTDPDIIFSIGKPTEGKLIEPHGMGTAGDGNGNISFFIDFQPAKNLLEELEAHLREALGDEKAEAIFKKVHAAAELIKEGEKKEKVDADS